MSILVPRPVTRRSVLRGALGGATIGISLPFLDAFLNENGTALAGTGAPLPVRFGTWYWGLGHTRAMPSCRRLALRKASSS